MMTLLASYLIALGERRKPRKERLSPGLIFWLSLAWPVTIFASIVRAWAQVLAAATLTRDEKKDDRIAAQQKQIAALEAQARKPIDE